MSIFGFWSTPPTARTSKGAAAPESSKRSNSGDDGAFLLKLVAMLQAQSDRADNTPLELNATAIEYLSSFVTKSRLRDQAPLSIEVQKGVRQLERLLLQVRHLKITLSRSKRRVDVSPFAALQVLEVNGVPVSSLEGHTALRMQLKSLRFEGAPLESVADLLAPGFVAEEKREAIQAPQEGRLQQRRAASNNNGLQRQRSSGDSGSEDHLWLTARWGQLTTLVLNNCGLGEGAGPGLNDDTLRLAWQAKVIMLRSNGIRSIESAFSHCSQLESLDLSRNQLTILPPLHLSLGNVTVLCLSQNEIAHTTGLERLFCLVELDLRDNFIRDLREVHHLGSLPNLESLWLRGNPLETSLEEYKGAYRRRVFGVFTEYGERGGTVDYPTVDGLRMSDLERSHLLKEVFVKATGSLASTSNAQAARSVSATMTTTTTTVATLSATLTAEDWAIATASNNPMPSLEALGTVPESAEAPQSVQRFTRTAVIEDMSEERMEERRQREMEALDHGADSAHGPGGKTPSTMYYVTKYVPPPKPDPPPPMPEETVNDEDETGNEETPIPLETLAELISKTPHEMYRSVAKCRKCGEYLPTQVDQIQEHLELCKGDLHLKGLASNDAIGHDNQEANEEMKAEKDDFEEEDTDEAARDNGSTSVWTERLTKLAFELGSTESGLVLDRRFGKRILRRAVVGRDMVDWLLAQCPTACRDEEEAVVIGQTLMDRHFLVPLFHSDTFRFSDLFYRFQWDHKELSGQNRSRPRLGSSTAQIASLDAESAAVRPTAADFGQFDPQVLLDLVDRMRLGINVKTRAPYRSVSTSSGLFRECFKGSDAISWLIQSSEAADEIEALELGGALLCSGIVFLVTTRPDPLDSMPPPRSHLLHTFQNSASAFYRFSSAWVKRQRRAGTVYQSHLLSPHQEAQHRENTTIISKQLPLTESTSEQSNRGDQLLLSGGLAYFRSGAMLELKYAVNDNEEFHAVEHFNQLLEATVSKQDGEETSRVEQCEEILTPILISALAERLRLVPNIVQDRHVDSRSVKLSSAWLMGSSDGKDWRRKDQEDEAAAYPSTFLGSEAVAWMVSSLALCDNDDALVLGDLLLHLGLVTEVEPINPESIPSMWASSPSKVEYRGFQNRRSVRYRFAKDDILVREAAMKDYMQFQSAQASPHPPPVEESPSESRSNMDETRQRSRNIKEDHGEGGEENEERRTTNEVFPTLTNALSNTPTSRERCAAPKEDDTTSNSASPDRTKTELIKVPMPEGATEGDVVEVRLGGGLRTARVTIPAGSKPGDLLSVHVPRPPPPPPKRSPSKPPQTGASSSLSSASLAMESFVSAASSSSAYLNPFVSPASPTSPDEKDAHYVGPTEVSEYVGDAEASDFLVGDNFVLYLRLQVFAPRQCSTARLAVSSSSGSSSAANKGNNRTLLRLPPRWVDEEFQSGTLLPCLPWKSAQPDGMAHLFKLAPRLSEEGTEEKRSSDVTESPVWLVFTNRHVYFIDDACLAGSRRLNLRFCDAPRPVVLRRYPLHCLQLLKIGFSFQSLMFAFAGAEKDADGLHAAPSSASSSISTGDNASRRRSGSTDHSSGAFGSSGGSFVRGGLHVGQSSNGAAGASRVFVVDGVSGAVSLLSDTTALPSLPSTFDRTSSSDESAASSSSHVVQAGGFVFLTRDKAVTSALLTEVSELATLGRAKQKPPVLPEEVPVTNNDDEVLEALGILGIHDQASSCFYQLCHQRWNSRPKLLSPRTVVITATSVFLCFEDHGGLGRGAPRLHVIDQALLGEVANVRPEKSPNEVTILVRRPLKHKRWRLLLSSRTNADRLITEVRRCIGAEDHELEDDDMMSRGSIFNDVTARSSVFSDSVRASMPSRPSLFGRSKS